MTEEGAIIKDRLPDAANARAMYKELVRGDLEANKRRAMEHAMFDGHPPYDSAQLKAMGQGHRTNLDYGDAAALMEDALAAYNDLNNGVDILARAEMEESDYTEEERSQKSAVISEEFTRTNKQDWEDFQFNWQRAASLFVGDGLGITYFPDEIDWRFDCAKISDTFFPRDTKARESSVEFLFLRDRIRVNKLYQQIEDETVAANSGWDVAQVKDAIVKHWVTKRGPAGDPWDWDYVVQQIKNNDLYCGYVAGRAINIVHCWVQEYNGTISHKIFLQDDVGDKFLFSRPSRYKNSAECFTIFPYGIGDGTYYSIRGLGYKIFKLMQVLNRLKCTFVDGTMLSSCLLTQPAQGEDFENMGISMEGPIAILQPGLNVSPRQIPNLAQNTLPAIQLFGQNLQNNSGSYQTRELTPDHVERTATEISLQASKETVLSTAAVKLFMQPKQRVYTEQFRRLINEGYQQSDPGGKEAFQFRIRCMKRGVSMDDLRKVRCMIPVAPLGNGSPSARILLQQQLLQLAGGMDEVGKMNALRDMVTALAGSDAAGKYVPNQNMVRQPIDAQIAILENGELLNGTTIPVTQGQNHAVHAAYHIQDMNAAIQSVQQEGIQPERIYGHLAASLEHTTKHVQILSQDPARKQESAQARKMLQQIGAFAQKIGQSMQAKAEAAQKQAQDGGGQPGEPQGGPDPTIFAKIQQAQVQIQIMQEKAQQQLQIHAAKAKQQMTINDLKHAQKLSEQSDLNRARQLTDMDRETQT